MKSVKWLAPVALLWSFAASSNTFEGLYELGKKNNLLLKAQNALQESEKQQENVAFANLLPRAALLGNWNYQQQKSSVDSDSYLDVLTDRRNQADGFGYELSVTQPLFNMQAYYNYERGQGVAKRAGIVKTQAKLQFIQDYSEAYLTLVTDWQRLDNIEKTLEAYKAQRDVIVKQYEIGLARPSDLQQARASLASLEAQSISVKSSLAIGFRRLELLLQSPVTGVNSMVANVDQLIAIEPSMQHYMFKFNQNVDYQIAFSEVNIADKTLKASETASWPTVAASLRYSDNHFDNTFDFQPGNTIHQDGLSFAVQVTVPLYAGSADTYSKRASAYSYQSAKLQKQFVEHQVKQSIRSVYLNLKAGIALVQSRQASVLASTQALENAKTEYSSGIGQYLNVRNSQDRLFEQTNQLITERNTFVANYFLLARLTGEEPDVTIEKMKSIFMGEEIGHESE